MGFVYTDVGEKLDETGQKTQDLSAKIEALSKINPDVKVKASNISAGNPLDSVNAEEMGFAVSQAISARIHGASVKAATETGAAVLKMMGKQFEDSQLELMIKAKIDFDNFEEMANEQLNQLSTTMSKASKGTGAGFWEGLGRVFNGSGDLRGKGAQAIKEGVDEWYATFDKLEGQAREKAFNKMSKEVNQSMQATF